MLPGAARDQPMTALAGLRVLDLSRVLAGPSCGQLLGDFGAEVIKVEDRRGDENRAWLPIVDGRSANFFSVNAGKRGLTLNLKSPQGQAILERLVARSDVLIENFPPATRERLGLGHKRLRGINDRLVQVSVTGYGGEGPMADRPGYDNMLQGFSGMMAMTGENDRGPARLGTSIVDLGTGMLAFGGVMAALFARAEGRASGQHVEVSLMQTALAQLGYHFTAYTMAGVVPERGGSGVWHIVPYQAFPTTDGHILAGATNDATWQRMALAMGAEALAADPRFLTNAGRVEHRVALIAALEALFATRPTDDWMTMLDAAKVPCSPVLEIDKTLAHPQVRAMGMVTTVPDDRGGTIDLCGVPLSLSETPSVPRRRPPDLGEHTDEILADLGLTPDDIETLRREGAI